MFKKILFLIGTLSALAGCKGITYEFTRTAQTPYRVEVSQDVQLYRQECTPVETWGPSSQCGPGEWKELCERASNGEVYCRQTMEYPACRYTYQDCKSVPSRVVTAFMDVDFDTAAVLQGNEQEIFKFEVDYKDGYFIVEGKAKNSKYRYKRPEAIAFYPDQRGYMKFELSR